MKKIFTLTTAVMLTSFIFAQHNSGDYYPYNNDGYRHDNNRPVRRFTVYDRDAIIARINMRYDERIFHIKHNWQLRRFEKRKMIRHLEFERKAEINAVYARFNGRKVKRMPDYADYDSHRH